MTSSNVYTSDSKYVFTTRYTDYALTTNKHPEATVNIAGKAGYILRITELTVNICAEKSGKKAYCTYLIKDGSKLINPEKEIQSGANSYTPVKISINQDITAGSGAVFYLHLKTSVSTSKAMVKSFQLKYEYVKISTVDDGDGAEGENTGGTLEYIIQISGTQEAVDKAYDEIVKSIGDTATVTKYTQE
jgi:hypothetical protein